MLRKAFVQLSPSVWRAAGALQILQPLAHLHTDGHVVNESSSNTISALKYGILSLTLGSGLYALSGNSSQQVQADAPAAAQVTVAPPTDPYQRPSVLKGLPKHITLYQYDVCPYCCKVKGALDYFKLPYSVIEVNPLTKAEIKWSSYKKVPVVKLGEDEVVADSSAIISRLAAEVEAAAAAEAAASSKAQGIVKGWFSSVSKPSSAGAGAGPSGEQLEEEVRWRRWVDDRFVKIVTANVYRNWSESQQMFTYITKQGNWSWASREAARWSGALIMWRIGTKMPEKYAIKRDVRDELYVCVQEFLDAIGTSRPFLGGDKPGLADLGVFGVLRAVAGTDTFNDVLTKTEIAPWYERMRNAVGPTSRVVTKE